MENQRQQQMNTFSSSSITNASQQSFNQQQPSTQNLLTPFGRTTVSMQPMFGGGIFLARPKLLHPHHILLPQIQRYSTPQPRLSTIYGHTTFMTPLITPLQHQQMLMPQSQHYSQPVLSYTTATNTAEQQQQNNIYLDPSLQEMGGGYEIASGMYYAQTSPQATAAHHMHFGYYPQQEPMLLPLVPPQGQQHHQPYMTNQLYCQSQQLQQQQQNNDAEDDSHSAIMYEQIMLTTTTSNMSMHSDYLTDEDKGDKKDEEKQEVADSLANYSFGFGDWTPVVPADGMNVAFVSSMTRNSSAMPFHQERSGELIVEIEVADSLANYSFGFGDWTPDVPANGTVVAFISSRTKTNTAMLFDQERSGELTVEIEVADSLANYSFGFGDWTPDVPADSMVVAFVSSRTRNSNAMPFDQERSSELTVEIEAADSLTNYSFGFGDWKPDVPADSMVVAFISSRTTNTNNAMPFDQERSGQVSSSAAAIVESKESPSNNSDCQQPLISAAQTETITAATDSIQLQQRSPSIPKAENNGTKTSATLFKKKASDAVIVNTDQRLPTDQSNNNSPMVDVKPENTTKKKAWTSLFANDSANGLVVDTDQKWPPISARTTATTTNDSVEPLTSPSLPQAKNTATKLWTSLFKTQSTFPPSFDADIAASKKVVLLNEDPWAHNLAKQLRSMTIIHREHSFQSHGLYNGGHWCYVNSVLQSLIACPPFFHLMRQFADVAKRPLSATPILDALSLFIMHFTTDQNRYVQSNRANFSQPINSEVIRTMVMRLKSDAAYKGRQEDAEELLLALLNALHDEMIAVMTMDGQQMAPGNKLPIIRQLMTTPLSQIFMGRTCHSTHQLGSKDSATIEPFFTLPLDIQSSNVFDVTSALMATLCSEMVKGLAPSATTGKDTKETELTRRGSLHNLPPVLILQLKYFVYSPEGVKKLLKPIQYRDELQIPKELISQSSQPPFSSFNRKYKLFAVIVHHGWKAQGGHYTTRVYSGGHWLLIDDAMISNILLKEVTTCRMPDVPYLLFYHRCDLLQQT